MALSGPHREVADESVFCTTFLELYSTQQQLCCSAQFSSACPACLHAPKHNCRCLAALHNSVKDRIAYSMISAAEEQGLISPGKTLLVCACGCGYGCGRSRATAGGGGWLVVRGSSAVVDGESGGHWWQQEEQPQLVSHYYRSPPSWVFTRHACASDATAAYISTHPAAASVTQ